MNKNKYGANNLGRTIIWFVIMMALGNASLLFSNVILGNIVRSVLVIAVYVVFKKMNAGAATMRANVAGQNTIVKKLDTKSGMKMVIPVLVIIVFSFVLEWLMSKALGGTGSAGTINDGSSASIWGEYLVLAVSTAICEELTFRAMPITAINTSIATSNDNNVNNDKLTIKIILITSAVFGLFHIANLITEGNMTGVGIVVGIAQAVGAFGYGIAYAAIFCRCGSIIPAIALHFINNMFAYISGAGVGAGMSGSGSTSIIVITILSALLGAAFCGIYGMWLVKKE